MQGITAKNPPKKAKKREAKRTRATKATIGRSSRQGCMRETERVWKSGATSTWKTLSDRAKREQRPNEEEEDEENRK